MINALGILEELFPRVVGEVGRVEAELVCLIHHLLHIELVIDQVYINDMLHDLIARFLHLHEVDVGARVACLLRYHGRCHLRVLRIHLFILFLSIYYIVVTFYFI